MKIENKKIKKTNQRNYCMQKQGFYNRKIKCWFLKYSSLFQNTIVGGNQITRKTIV